MEKVTMNSLKAAWFLMKATTFVTVMLKPQTPATVSTGFSFTFRK
jgi:hypothetical protein